MIFPTIARSLLRSSRARNLLHSDGRFGAPVGAQRSRGERGLGFLRGYIAPARTGSNGFGSNFSDFNSIGANPRLLRLFSSESPKKKYCKNFYPKEKKEDPKGKDSKQESKDKLSGI